MREFACDVIPVNLVDGQCGIGRGGRVSSDIISVNLDDGQCGMGLGLEGLHVTSFLVFWFSCT